MLARAHLWLLPLVFCFSGCTADLESLLPPDHPWVAPGDLDNEEGRCNVRPDIDSDNDGLLDIFEDLNRNCLVDPGETDPFDPDSDGDGLLDGDEDADGNGVWDEDRGELNPRLADTDGDGVPDGEEPKAQVCNRAHATLALAERRVLGPRTAMYVHPRIQRAEPFGFSGAVLLKGRGPNEGGLLFETAREDGAVQQILERLYTALHRNTEEASIHLVGERNAAPYGQAIAHLRATDTTLRFPTLLENLQDLAPELGAEMAERHSYTVNATDLTFQLMGEVQGERVRWALAWKETERSSLWFSVLHPRLIAENPSDTIRFVCEDVESLQRPALDILLVIEGGADTSGQVQPWLASVDYIVQARRQTGLVSRLFLLVPAEGEQPDSSSWEWMLLDSDRGLEGQDTTELPLFDGTMDRVVAQAASAPPAPESTGHRELAIMVFSGGGHSELPRGERRVVEDLPEFSEELETANFVIVSPSKAPYDCSWRMTGERSDAVERLVRWSRAYHLSGCNLPPTKEASQRILAPMIGWAWAGTVRDAIWGTVFLAAGDHSVPAEVTIIGGQRALVAPEAEKAAHSAVSFAAWFPVTPTDMPENAAQTE